MRFLYFCLVFVFLLGCETGGAVVDAGTDGSKDGLDSGDDQDGGDSTVDTDGADDVGDESDSGFDAGDSDSIVPRGNRLLGIALSGTIDENGEEESFEQQRLQMVALKADFINFPLDWRMIEPGPDDDFSYLGLDPNRWETSGEPAPASPDDFVTYTGTNESTGWMRTRYVLHGDLETEIHWTIPSDAVIGTTLTLLLDFGGQGGRCDAGDQFVAMTLSKESGTHSTNLARCKDGVFTLLATSPYAGSLEDVTVRIERRQGQLRFLLEGSEVLSLDATGTLAEDARPYLYINGREDSPGTVHAIFDDWSIGATENTFDSPELRYSVDPGFFDIIAVVNMIYSGMKLGLSIRTINTNHTEIPSDLQALINPLTDRVDFSNPRVAQRFSDFTEYLFGRLSDEINLVFVSVGNEIDIYLGDDLLAWDAYASFVETVTPLVRTHLDALQGGHSGIAVGAKITHDVLGLNSEIQTQADRVIAASDAVMFNFYPMNPDFTLAHASSIDETISAALDRFDPAKPIFITEFGIHSASPNEPVCDIQCPQCTGSEEIQASYYRTLFQVWDKHSDRVQLVMLNWLTDIPCSAIHIFEDYYGISDPGFLTYLGTLGLRRKDGTRKAAFDAISDEASARGW